MDANATNRLRCVSENTVLDEANQLNCVAGIIKSKLMECLDIL